MFGARQSGVPQFPVGDIVTDFNILEVARQEASALWKVKEWWQYPAYQGLANRSETPKMRQPNFSIRRGNFCKRRK